MITCGFLQHDVYAKKKKITFCHRRNIIYYMNEQICISMISKGVNRLKYFSKTSFKEKIIFSYCQFFRNFEKFALNFTRRRTQRCINYFSFGEILYSTTNQSNLKILTLLRKLKVIAGDSTALKKKKKQVAIHHIC